MKEQKIKGKTLLLKVLVGSQAYGTSTPQSDEDFKGIYLETIQNILLGKNKSDKRNQITVSKDEVYFEIDKFISLIKSSNPTILEMLFAPEDCIIYKHPMLDELFEKRDKFLSKKCEKSFGGYAVAQIKKAAGLNKKMNWDKQKVTKKTPIDFCYVHLNGEASIPLRKWLEFNHFDQMDFGLAKVNNFDNCYSMYRGCEFRGILNDDESSNELRLSSIPIHLESTHMISYNQNGYKMHCKEFRQYQEWLEKRNTDRYVDTQAHGQKIDGKNMMHCRRLISTAVEIAQGKGVMVRRPDAEYLLSIRKGEVNLEKLIEDSQKDLQLLKELYPKCDLPEKVDKELCDNILYNIRSQQLFRETGGEL